MHWKVILFSLHPYTYSFLILFLIAITCEKLQDFVTKFFSHVHIEALLHGNLSKQVLYAIYCVGEVASSHSLHKIVFYVS